MLVPCLFLKHTRHETEGYLNLAYVEAKGADLTPPPASAKRYKFPSAHGGGRGRGGARSAARWEGVRGGLRGAVMSEVSGDAVRGFGQ